MNIILPDSDGWSALPLVDDEWGRTGVVVKREFQISGGVAVPSIAPEGIVVADQINTTAADPNIEAEGETALFKTQPDWHFRGYRSAGDTLRTTLQSAEMRVNGVIRASYVQNPFIDPDNLFGFEPRESRIGLGDGPFVTQAELAAAITLRDVENAANGIVMDRAELSATVLSEVFGFSFNFAAQTPDIFRSSRRSAGYAAPNHHLPIPAQMAIEVDASDLANDFTILSLDLAIPTLDVTAFLYEGGPDSALVLRRASPSAWCPTRSRWRWIRPACCGVRRLMQQPIRWAICGS